MERDVKEELKCDDAKIMRIWRECGLPEYFLGNGGTNHKLLAFAEACAALTVSPPAGGEGRKEALREAEGEVRRHATLAERMGRGDDFDKGYAFACKMILDAIAALPLSAVLGEDSSAAAKPRPLSCEDTQRPDASTYLLFASTHPDEGPMLFVEGRAGVERALATQLAYSYSSVEEMSEDHREELQELMEQFDDANEWSGCQFMWSFEDGGICVVKIAPEALSTKQAADSQGPAASGASHSPYPR